MKTEDGYYWIKLKHENAKWQPAESCDNIWYLFGNEHLFFDNEIAEVGERIRKKDGRNNKAK